MYCQFLIEDQSTEVLVRHVMSKLKQEYPPGCEIYYDLKSFKGIGALPKRGSIQSQKNSKLLNSLPLYLKAFNRRLSTMENASLFIVLDNDRNDPVEFRMRLERIAESNLISLDHVFCIAIKESEAWLLGDHEALLRAYPNAKENALKHYKQDSLEDTWQVLADAVYQGGLRALKKSSNGSYAEIGAQKYEWADKIGAELELSANQSPSFNYFIQQLRKRITMTA